MNPNYPTNDESILNDDEEDQADHLRHSVDDMSDDAEVLASAGWGTDEDYGYYGGGEE